MNAIKIALLGTAALAAVSVSARADDLSDLKSQIEALNSRIATLESTPSMPAGYQLLTVSESDAIIIPGLDADKDYGKKATNIGVMPTADVPASTNIQWSGFVRAGVVFKNYDRDLADQNAGTIATARAAAAALPAGTPAQIAARNAAIAAANALVVGFDTDSVDLVTRAGIKVVGTTDTAIGEVGVRVALLASVETIGGVNRSHDAAVATDGYWGWWAITPELTLGGGVDGSLANSSNAFDNRCSCAYIDTGGAFGKGDPSQIRLSYASGPISFAVAVEDYDNVQVLGSSKSSLGVAGEMKWSGDSFGFDLNAGFWDTAGAGDADWTVNAGANFGLGDVASIGVAVGMGESGHVAGDKFTRGSVFLGFNLSDAVSAELGGAYTDLSKGDTFTVAGGLYYTPVSQLTLGLEASYTDLNATALAGESVVAAGIAVWRF